MLGQEVCENAERYDVAAAWRIETFAGSVFDILWHRVLLFLVSYFETQPAHYYV
jgi:hypothetical protein